MRLCSEEGGRFLVIIGSSINTSASSRIAPAFITYIAFHRRASKLFPIEHKSMRADIVPHIVDAYNSIGN